MPLQLSNAASVTPLKFFVSLFDFFAYAQAKENNVCGAACELQWWHLVEGSVHRPVARHFSARKRSV